MTATAKSVSCPDVSTATKRVLVIEDDASVRQVVRDVLEIAGYEVEVVGTAAAGITAARVQRPDVIVLDVGLPGTLTGEEAMPVLIRFAPVIVITGRDEVELQQRLIGQGAVGYMRKPFDLQQLVDAVKAALDRPRPES